MAVVLIMATTAWTGFDFFFLDVGPGLSASPILLAFIGSWQSLF